MIVKKFILELEPRSVEVIHDAIANYHKHLHAAKDFKIDLGITDKEVQRRILKTHSLMKEFENARFGDTETAA